MRRHYPSVSLENICRLFGMSRQSYYKHSRQHKEQMVQDEVILQLVKEVRDKLPRTGTRKLLYMLKEPFRVHGIEIGRDKLFELLQVHGLLVRARKRRYPNTTNSKHWLRKYPDLVKEFVVYMPEQVWVSDITYLSLPAGFCYLSLITDAYSKRIMGYCLCHTLESKGPLAALQMALQSRQYGQDGLIHHSDRGIQYCCKEYIALLNKHEISISMTKGKDAYENAIAERVNGILKSELGLSEIFTSWDQAVSTVAQKIASYNALRPHASCDYLTPEQAHQKEGILPKRWKTYRKKYTQKPTESILNLNL